jgi:pantetheine-phosphate adenylyltransferase
MIAVFPGSFDPVTNGHLDIIKRSSRIFDQLVVLIMTNTSKKSLFSIDERKSLLQQAVAELSNVEVKAAADNLTVDVVKKLHAAVIIRGVRNVSDYSFERDISLLNRQLDQQIETFLLPCNPKFSMISSSYIKEIASFNGNLAGLVPSFVEKALKERLKANE